MTSRSTDAKTSGMRTPDRRNKCKVPIGPVGLDEKQKRAHMAAASHQARWKRMVTVWEW